LNLDNLTSVICNLEDYTYVVDVKLILLDALMFIAMMLILLLV
jgi:hypothetical protein